MSSSFSAGVGQWVGESAVYSPDGTYLGPATDQRTVLRNDDGVVTVDVRFDGPFSLAGSYSIADHGTHRRYLGPLNYGWADPIGDNVVAAHNYWPDLGLSQRFVLMVLAPGDRQLSLALISRGEHLEYVVVGEFRRRVNEGDPEPEPAPRPPATSRLLRREGTWTGELSLFDPDLTAHGTTHTTHVVAGSGATQTWKRSGLAFADDVEHEIRHDGLGSSTPAGSVVGTATTIGGRAMTASLLHRSNGRRVWRREVASGDGSVKGVLDLWFEGERRVGAATGLLHFNERRDGDTP